MDAVKAAVRHDQDDIAGARVLPDVGGDFAGALDDQRAPIAGKPIGFLDQTIDR